MEINDAKTIQTQLDEATTVIKQLSEEALSFSSAKASLSDTVTRFHGMLQKMSELIEETARLHQEVDRLSIDNTLLEFSKRTEEIKEIMSKYEQDQCNTFTQYETKAQEIITKTQESINTAFKTFLERAAVLTHSIEDFESKQSKVVLDIKETSMECVNKTLVMLKKNQTNLFGFVSIISIVMVIISILIALFL